MSPGHFSSEALIRQIRGGTAFGATPTCLSHCPWFWAMISFAVRLSVEVLGLLLVSTPAYS